MTLHAGTSVGQDGFGYATYQGVHHKIPQAGNVVIEDDVEIGANCSIDRAAVGSTVVGRGSKFSDNVVIGHGTKVGPHALLVAQVGIAAGQRQITREDLAVASRCRPRNCPRSWSACGNSSSRWRSWR